MHFDSSAIFRKINLYLYSLKNNQSIFRYQSPVFTKKFYHMHIKCRNAISITCTLRADHGPLQNALSLMKKKLFSIKCLDFIPLNASKMSSELRLLFNDFGTTPGSVKQ